MTHLPIVNYRTMEKILLNLGFQVIRQKGSHVFYRHPDGRTTTLPKHASRDIARPLMNEIIREIKITPERFLEELNKL
jgi:predicted RNA binding protein YcfA (HicA-like mRNA interferase family)